MDNPQWCVDVSALLPSIPRGDITAFAAYAAGSTAVPALFRMTIAALGQTEPDSLPHKQRTMPAAPATGCFPRTVC
jgi:hypothetical protein